MALPTGTVALLNRMNKIAKNVGLGSILGNMSHYVLAAGTQSTAAGSASQTITIAGLTASDIAVVILNTVGATPRTILTAKAASGQINVVMSGDPSTDHSLTYLVWRVM